MSRANFDLVANLVKKDIRVRYMGSALGFLWSLGSPLLTTLTFLVVFKFIFSNPDPKYVLHLVTGILHWTLFSQLVLQSCDWLYGNGNLIKKINFDRVLLPVAGAGTVLIFWLTSLAVYMAAFLPLGGSLSWSMLYYPIVFIGFLSFALGISLIFSVLYVKLRDIKHLVEVLMPILFWLTPIVWQPEALTSEVRSWIELNPLNVFFDAFNSILYAGISPSVQALAGCLLLGLTVLVFGFVIFRKESKTIVEEL
ncbi:ABC transporter permease [Pseudomonas sp. RIT623]|uniref:ABC transporter permease n=1 Tax=Pseudomonas sp. RIT623 TaxID=2559075 RepID=UPI00106F57FB|nr:ABC transporter permease [Pseudomonas sp. RIT623]TFF33866.1 ABC transporter permease [Pseudomonas sp. RIT623]